MFPASLKIHCHIDYFRASKSTEIHNTFPSFTLQLFFLLSEETTFNKMFDQDEMIRTGMGVQVSAKIFVQLFYLQDFSTGFKI